MNTLVIIPVCNFIELLNTIITFYAVNLNEADIVVVDDGDKLAITPFFIDVKKEIAITVNTRHGYLSQAYLDGMFVAENHFGKKYDLVITNEHDVVPTLKSLYACLEVFNRSLCVENVASVSTIYKWNHNDCYPTHPHWYNGTTLYEDKLCGEVKFVGMQGVPFGFTLWKEKALKLLSPNELPPIWKLDSEFGKFLFNKGYHHLRLTDFFVLHHNKGVKSWKEVN